MAFINSDCFFFSKVVSRVSTLTQPSNKAGNAECFRYVTINSGQQKRIGTNL